MEDLELLEFAAKAAGYTWIRFTESSGEAWWHENPDVARPWNPLDDDGDALRLAVKLEIEIRVFNGKAHAGKQNKSWCTEHVITVGDQCAATRRAIVRAAAAMATE